MQFMAVVSAIFGGVRIAADLLEYIGGLKNWSGGAKLASELRAIADRSKDAFRTDPVFKDEIEADRLEHIW